MENNKSKSREPVKIIGNIAVTVLAIFALFLMICPICGIHIFTFGLGGKYTSRVDCLDGYYVAVYENDVCHYLENGEDCLRFGNVDSVKDFDWKHSEVLDVVPYRRFLCFSKETGGETYYLTNSAGTVRYGVMYVLRTSGDKIHYYYRRDYHDGTLEFPPILYSEKIAFSYNEESYNLEKFSFFTSDGDFTTSEHILMMEGEPCYFRPLPQ